MVNVVVRSIVASDVLKRIPGQCISTVVVNRLHGAADVEQDGHTRRHHADLVGQARARGIQHEALHRMIVKRAVGVGHVEAVMTSMPVRCEAGMSVSTIYMNIGARGFDLLYIHLLTCMARCQKYCHESKKTTATHIWNVGITAQ